MCWLKGYNQKVTALITHSHVLIKRNKKVHAINLIMRTNHTPFCLNFYVLNIKPWTYFVVLWVRLRVLYTLAKHSTAKLHPQPTLKCSMHLRSQQLSFRSCSRP